MENRGFKITDEICQVNNRKLNKQNEDQELIPAQERIRAASAATQIYQLYVFKYTLEYSWNSVVDECLLILLYVCMRILKKENSYVFLG